MLKMFSQVRLINYTNMFSRHDFKKNNQVILNYVKMGESLNIYPSVSNQTQFRSKKINKIRGYSIAENCETEAVNQ